MCECVSPALGGQETIARAAEKRVCKWCALGPLASQFQNINIRGTSWLPTTFRIGKVLKHAKRRRLVAWPVLWPGTKLSPCFVHGRGQMAILLRAHTSHRSLSEHQRRVAPDFAPNVLPFCLGMQTPARIYLSWRLLAILLVYDAPAPRPADLAGTLWSCRPPSSSACPTFLAKRPTRPTPSSGLFVAHTEHRPSTTSYIGSIASA